MDGQAPGKLYSLSLKKDYSLLQAYFLNSLDLRKGIPILALLITIHTLLNIQKKNEKFKFFEEKNHAIIGKIGKVIEIHIIFPLSATQSQTYTFSSTHLKQLSCIVPNYF